MTGPRRPVGEVRTAVLDFIRAYRTEHGYAPTVREITSAIGLRSYATTSRVLGELVTLGYLRRSARRSRALVDVYPPEPPS